MSFYEGGNKLQLPLMVFEKKCLPPNELKICNMGVGAVSMFKN
jgi:hypothetical protein